MIKTKLTLKNNQFLENKNFIFSIAFDLSKIEVK